MTNAAGGFPSHARSQLAPEHSLTYGCGDGQDPNAKCRGGKGGDLMK